ncbi:helix-turn-helix transcriptional regulator [Novosphingobium sp. MW5]|nr:helix-turn-helix transcriptional regulator [Novosphingobium sp. MW5]
MPPLDHAAIPLARLSDKEVEILRLLTAGHTVKSIAARLGRSEASINERLRDARRKTGIGSSRELARILNAQENWDEKIDLSAGSPSAEVAMQPAIGWHPLSKGSIIMLVTLSVAAAAGLVMAAPEMLQGSPPQMLHAAASKSSPLAGRWSLDVARIPEEERPQRVTIDFRELPDRKWTVRVEMVGADGKAMHAESTAAADGVPVAGTGNMPFVDTVTLRQPGPNTLVMSLGKNGAPVSTRVYTVSKDRKSMTETIIWPGNSIPKLETTYFKRIG